MPGIVGLITKEPREHAERKLLQMVETIRHEPSYEVGTWVDESLGVYVGWAARKGSFSDGMPVRNERGSFVLIFSGEEYSEPGVLQSLKQHGHNFSADGASYLVHLCEEEADFPVQLNGRFHGLIANLAEGTATLFNDRYGSQRLYYHKAANAFYFAAEAKAILAVRPELRSIDPQGLGEFVSCGCVLENRSLFKGIYLLPQGSAWTFKNGAITESKTYFSPKQWEQQEVLSQEAYYQELRSVFPKILSRYFNGRERVGMSLTGGLDTRMILAWHQSAPGSMPCYSFGGMFRDCEDVRLARKVAKACEQPFEVIPVGSEFLSKFAHYAERTVYLTDGCTPVRHSSDLYVNERAAKIAPARMTGNYGGEILRQLRAFKPGKPASNLFRPELMNEVQAARNRYEMLVQGHALSFIAFCQVPWHHYGLLSLEQSQLSLRSPFLDNDLVRTAYRSPLATTSDGNLFKESHEAVRLIADGSKDLHAIPTDRGLAGTSGKLKRNLTAQYLEFTFKAEYAYDYGMPQWLARFDHRVSSLHLEKLFLGRHKFNHFRVWYRDALSDYVRDMLLDSRSLSRPYLNRSSVESIVKGHLKGDQNFTTEIHQLLTLELICRLFVDAN